MEMEIFDLLKEKVFKLVDFEYDGEIVFTDSDCVFASLKDGKAQVGGAAVAQTARALFLFAKSVSEGKQDFEIKQQPAFSHLGAMVDCSRNAVMRVEKVKEFIDYLACLGMNTLMLYTEDVYELKEYSMFGYMRGRYSAAELKELDDYAFDMGVELIPCIQTLGHMEQYLQWSAAEEVKDTRSVLLIDEPKTYELIECILKTLRGVFRTDKIHIGMDEAWDVGLGKYLKQHGYNDRLTILSRHLNRVCGLCEQYDFHPMMWSDMFFRLSSDGGYESPDCEFSDEMVNSLPEVGLVYWNYCTDEDFRIEDFKLKMLKKHRDLKQKIIFAGGCDTWLGFLPWSEHAAESSKEAMKACIAARDVDMVFTTMWADSGCETNQFYAVSLLTVYSEYCYRGAACCDEDIASAAEFLTKIPYSLFMAMENSSPLIKGKRLSSRAVLHGNLLYRIGLSEDEDCKAFVKIAEAAAADFRAAADRKDKNYALYHYSSLIFSIIHQKAELMLNIRTAYQKDDMAYLTKAAEDLIPKLSNLYEELEKIHFSEWMHTYKPFGYEVIAGRYGAQIAMNQTVCRRLLSYAAGELDKLEELEQELQDVALQYPGGHHFTNASVIH